MGIFVYTNGTIGELLLMKKLHALTQETDARIAGVALKVPNQSWEDRAVHMALAGMKPSNLQYKVEFQEEESKIEAAFDNPVAVAPWRNRGGVWDAQLKAFHSEILPWLGPPQEAKVIKWDELVALLQDLQGQPLGGAVSVTIPAQEEKEQRTALITELLDEAVLLPQEVDFFSFGQ